MFYIKLPKIINIFEFNICNGFFPAKQEQPSCIVTILNPHFPYANKIIIWLDVYI